MPVWRSMSPDKSAQSDPRLPMPTQTQAPFYLSIVCFGDGTRVELTLR